MAAFAIE